MELVIGGEARLVGQLWGRTRTATNATSSGAPSGRAAQRHSVGQSAMPSTLARLRRAFDDPLLTRDVRGLVATPLAESLAQPVRELLTGIDDVLALRDEFDPAAAQRTFSVIADDYLTMTFLQPLITRPEMQLDFLGVPRNAEITAGFGMAPFLLSGTRLIALVHERLGDKIREASDIRLLEPPILRLQPITEIMAWASRTDRDPGQRWFRQCLIDLAEHESPAPA